MQPRLVFGLLALAFAPVVAHPQTCQLDLWVSVVDTHARPIPGLSAADFATAQPKGASVTEAAPAPPQRVEILLDQSGSMRGPDGQHIDSWKYTEDITLALLHALPPTVQVGLAGFTDKFVWLEDFRPPDAEFRRVLDSAFHGSQPYGSTSFLDALAASLSRPDALRPGDIIFALTDAEDNSSRISLKQTVQQLLQARVRIAVLQIPNYPPPDPAASKPSNFYGLQLPFNPLVAPDPAKLVQQSGGLLVPFLDRPDVHVEMALTRDAWQYFAQQYLIRIALPGSRSKSNRVILQLAPRLRQNALLYPPVFAACPGRP